MARWSSVIQCDIIYFMGFRIVSLFPYHAQQYSEGIHTFKMFYWRIIYWQKSTPSTHTQLTNWPHSRSSFQKQHDRQSLTQLPPRSFHQLPPAPGDVPFQSGWHRPWPLPSEQAWRDVKRPASLFPTSGGSLFTCMGWPRQIVCMCVRACLRRFNAKPWGPLGGLQLSNLGFIAYHGSSGKQGYWSGVL